MKMEKSRLKIKNSPVLSSGIFTFCIVILVFSVWWFLNLGGKKEE
jgi:hypothetical protein